MTDALGEASWLPKSVGLPRLIVCECRGQWAVRFRRLLLPGFRLEETRSVPECLGALRRRPLSFVVVELTEANHARVLDLLVRMPREFPLAQAGIVAQRVLAHYEMWMREAGAVFFSTSRRDAPALARVISRHLASVPMPARPLTQRIWQALPWGARTD